MGVNTKILPKNSKCIKNAETA